MPESMSEDMPHQMPQRKPEDMPDRYGRKKHCCPIPFFLATQRKITRKMRQKKQLEKIVLNMLQYVPEPWQTDMF